MRFRIRFRRKRKNSTNTSTDTTIKGETNMTAFTKTPEFALAADVESSGIYPTARRAQGFLDDVDSLIEVVRLQSRKLNGVLIEGKRSPLAIVAAAEGSEDLATELEDLFDDMAAGWGRTVKKPAKGKASVDPTSRLDAVVESAEQMKNSLLFLLGSALKVAYDGNSAQIKKALGSNDIPASLIDALISAPEELAPTADEPVEGPAEAKVLVKPKQINNHQVKAEPVSA